MVIPAASNVGVESTELASSSESSRSIMTIRSFSGSYQDWVFILTSNVLLHLTSDGGIPHRFGEVGSSIDEGWRIEYVKSESMGAGDGVRANGMSSSTMDGFELGQETGEG